MPYVLIEHRVKDYATFESIFNDDAPRRRRQGSSGMQVLQPVDDPGQLVVLLRWDDAQKARAFADSLELHEAIEWASGGVTMPRIAVVEQIAQSDA